MKDQNNPYCLQPATLEWKENEVPASTDYDDIYFSKQQGLAETDYVFLQHNQLQKRWQQLDPNTPDTFTIAETGFGTGLNFLAACQLWLQTAPSHWQLHFISVEKHPLSKQDLSRALQAWPQLADLAQQLIALYPPLLPGQHSLALQQGRIHLHLLFNEASEGFEQCLSSHHPQFNQHSGPKVDAWFLDGFAPAKNPAMWSESLFDLIGRLSKAGTTAATFTAAGIVKRGLQSAGFEINKVKGFGHKREMLTAVYSSASNDTPPTLKKRQKPAWALYPTQEKVKQVAIIGGGLAGCTTAYALAQQGLQVSIIERHAELAQEASGNAQGMLYTKLSAQTGQLAQFSLSSYFFALRYYRQLQQANLLNSSSANFCGLLQLCTNDKQQHWLKEIHQVFGRQEWVKFVTPEQASALSGVDCQSPGYFLQDSGWISPTLLCQALSQQPNIHVLNQQQAIELEPLPQGWSIKDHSGNTLLSADAVVIANSHDAKQFSQTRELPLKIIRGQVTDAPAECFQQQPKTVICHEGYITPAIDGRIRFGATFDLGQQDKAVLEADHQRNIASLQQALPGVFAAQDKRLQGRANLRCTSPDYLPLVGPVAHHQQMLQNFLPLAKDAYKDIGKPGSYYPGLYINVGHGSKGLSSTPLCAQLLAALIQEQPRPLPRQLIEALNPARFLIRDIIRGKITQPC